MNHTCELTLTHDILVVATKALLCPTYIATVSWGMETVLPIHRAKHYLHVHRTLGTYIHTSCRYCFSSASVATKQLGKMMVFAY